MKFNVVTGLPRSGSTLFCNLLNQNPRFYASSTSPLADVFSNTVHMLSNSDEVKGELIRNRDKAEQQVTDMLTGLIEGRYKGEKRIVFDKGRNWTTCPVQLAHAYPDGKIIVLVRDLRAVFSSIRKQHMNTPMLDGSATPAERTMLSKADAMFSNTGLIGSAVIGVADLIRLALPNTIWVRYEDFVADPEFITRRVYKDMGEKWFKHDYANVENVSTDVDGLHLNKFPHEGSGKIARKEYEPLPADISELIMGLAPLYNQTFRYV